MNKKFTVFVILATVLQVGAVGAVSIDNVNKTGNSNPASVNEKKANSSPPQEIWNKTYGGDNFAAMDRTSDGGFVFAGETESSSLGLLVKTDKNGNTQWEYKSIFDSDFNDVAQTSDGGYIAVGDEYDSTPREGYIVKTDSQGNELWNRSIGNGDFVSLVSVIETSNGYIVTGYLSGGLIMKIDDSGNTVWNKSYGNSNSALKVLVEANNGYIAGGYTDVGNSNDDDPWWFKFDGSGNIVWNKTLDISDVKVEDMTREKNGEYGFTGPKNDDAWFGAIDGSGNVQWTKTIGAGETDRPDSIINTGSGYAMAGYTYSYGVNTPDKDNFWLLAVDGNGNERWNTTFGGTDYEAANDLVKDGGNFYLAGYTSSYGESGDAGWLVKAGPPEPPTADFSYTPSEVDAQEEITFDASSSSDPNNDITSYEWDFNGDGNTDATGKTTKYSFPQNGTYNVTLTVTDSRDNTDTTQKQIQVSAPNKSPSAKFNYSPKKPDPNQTVRFNASMSSDSDGSIASYDWEFNRSGFQISGEKVEYAFNQKGMHKVTLTVTDDDGATDKKSMVVNVTDVDVNSPPQAKFMYSPKNPKVSDSIKFNASMSSDADGDSLSYEWDFGDGNTSTGEKVSHSYAKSGNYTVELTVKDGDGANDTMTKTVNVTSEPSEMSIAEAIANLKSQNDIVNFSELQQAITFWIQDKEVPGTGGKKIDFSKLQDLISLWVQETEV